MSVAVIEIPDLQTPESLVNIFKENDASLLKLGLDKIHLNLPLYWPEFFESLNEIKSYAQNTSFQHHKLAALVVSKICFLASDLEQALEFALLADDCFDPNSTDEYNCAIINQCFERYIEFSRKKYEGHQIEIPHLLETIISEIIQENIKKKNYLHVVGLAVEMRSIDIIENTIRMSERDPLILAHCIDCVNCSHDNLPFRKEVIQKVLALYTSQENHNLAHVVKYLFMLNDRDKLITLLKRLIYNDKNSYTDIPIALQICFDLYDNCQQDFLSTIIYDLQTEASYKTAELIETGVIDIANQPASSDTYWTTSGVDYKTLPYLSSLHKMVAILDGTEPNKLHMDFLVRSLRYDLSYLSAIFKECKSMHNHVASSLCNALVHLGTASDSLVRSSEDWMGLSIAWSRFTMVASMGLIHRGHGETTLKILSPYMPCPTRTNSQYSDGGALFGIGLSHVNNGINVVDMFTEFLSPTTSNIIRHGACLGLGLSAFGSALKEQYQLMIDVLKEEDVLSGEAASISCGLIMVGSGNLEIYQTLKNIMLTTRHERIQRGCSLGIAMLFALKTSLVNPYIAEFIENESPIIRMGAMYTIAMAYAGTNDPHYVKLLWNSAVSDTSEDVRRAAIISLGMVMFREREKFLVIAVMFMYNHSHIVRCGAILAIGMVFAATGSEKVISLIRSFLSEPVALIRQTTYIACALVIIQTNDKSCPVTREVRTQIMNWHFEKNNDTIGRVGNFFGIGIMDAGGRNMTFTFDTLEGQTRIQSVVGFMLFQCYWYWMPFSCFISMCLVPTSIILVNSDLEMPKIKFTCLKDLEEFAYPVVAATQKKESNEKSL